MYSFNLNIIIYSFISKIKFKLVEILCCQIDAYSKVYNSTICREKLSSHPDLNWMSLDERFLTLSVYIFKWCILNLLKIIIK